MFTIITQFFNARLINSLFKKQAKVRLTAATNSTMTKYVGSVVTLKWVDKKLNIHLEKEGISIITSDIKGKPRIIDKAVEFYTSNNSTYQFCKL